MLTYTLRVLVNELKKNFMKKEKKKKYFDNFFNSL